MLNLVHKIWLYLVFLCGIAKAYLSLPNLALQITPNASLMKYLGAQYQFI